MPDDQDDTTTYGDETPSENSAEQEARLQEERKKIFESSLVYNDKQELASFL